MGTGCLRRLILYSYRKNIKTPGGLRPSKWKTTPNSKNKKKKEFVEHFTRIPKSSALLFKIFCGVFNVYNEYECGKYKSKGGKANECVWSCKSEQEPNLGLFGRKRTFFFFLVRTVERMMMEVGLLILVGGICYKR